MRIVLVAAIFQNSTLIADRLANSTQPLVPERVVTLGDSPRGAETGLFQSIMQVLMTWQHISDVEPPTPMPTSQKEAA